MQRFFVWSIFIIAFIATIFFLPDTPSYAQDTSKTYHTDLRLSYKIDKSGMTTIIQDYTITNLDPTIYINKYGFQTTVGNIYNVYVDNNGQSLQPEVQTNTESSSISFVFPEEIVGENKERHFSVQYQTNDLAHVAGNILELRVPKVVQPELYDSVTTELRVPIEFGQPSRINIQPSQVTDTANESILVFNNISEQITAFYGNSQSYSVTLRYNLENTTAGNAIAQIALPPDTSWQRVQYEQLEPLPQSIKSDEDGNWIATYQMSANTKLTVSALAHVSVALQPDTIVPVVSPLPVHMHSAEYWQVQDEKIKQLSVQYPTAAAINQFVVDSLRYNNLRTGGEVGRLGAKGALAQPTDAVCQEFTDLFITLARAAQIPARRLTGYAFSENRTLRPLSLEGDVLHAWPEYFDQEQQIWRQIDPTWQHTTNGIDYFSQFDVNHIVFAINGVSSSKPYPAGWYKTAAEINANDVVVTPTANFPLITPDIQVNLEPITFFTIQIPGFYNLRYTNLTGQAWYDVHTTLTGVQEGTSVDGLDTSTIDLLPFQTVEKNIVIRHLGNVQTTVGLQLNYGQQPIINNQYQVTSSPLPFAVPNFPVPITTMAAIFVIGTIIAGSILVFRRRK